MTDEKLQKQLTGKFNEVAEAFNQLAEDNTSKWGRFRFTYTVSLSVEPIPEVKEVSKKKR